MRSKVAGIDVPTLLIVGREDHYKPQMEWLANELPDASLHVFPDVGHMPFLEKPDLFLNTVSTWKKS